MKVFRESTAFHKVHQRAFTLIELLVVIAIFSIITSIALFDQSRVNSNVLLSNLTYDVGLTLRQAQTYGIGVKYDQDAPNSQGGFGVYFDTDSPNGIILFNDVDGNGIYEAATDSIEREYQFTNQRGNKIDSMYFINSNAEGNCGQMSITFKRPDPEPTMYCDGYFFSGPAYIYLGTEDRAICKEVVVEASGQIRVGKSDACVNIVPE